MIANAADGMEHIDHKDANALRKEMAATLDRYSEKPFVRLKAMAHHRWGALRMWPKWKSLRKIWGDWTPLALQI